MMRQPPQRHCGLDPQSLTQLAPPPVILNEVKDLIRVGSSYVYGLL